MKKYVLMMIFLFVLTGCKTIYFRSPITTEPPITIHPITPDDIFAIPEGATVEWEGIVTNVTGKRGWFISDFYMSEIMRAKVQ